MKRPNTSVPGAKRTGLLLVMSFLVLLGVIFHRTRGTAASPERDVVSTESQIKLGQNVLVSGSHSSWAHDEVMLSFDPTNPRRAVACSIVLVPEKAKRVTIAYATADGGESWQPTLLTDYTAESSDPICYMGPDGVGHFSTESTLESGEKVVEIYGSTDGGASWATRTVIPIQFEGFDREFMVADTTGGKFHGRLYLNAWTLVRSIDTFSRSLDQGDEYVSGLTVLRSTDKGEHWSGFVKRASLAGRWIGEPGNCVVLSTETLACVFIEPMKIGIAHSYVPAEGDLPNAWLRLFKSSDGGESLEAATTVSEIVDTQIHPGISLPQVAVDASDGVFKDRLYVVWQGQKNGHNEILLSYSADKGQSWSAPRKINDDSRALPRNPYMPEIAVNCQGVVAVGWYDAGDSPNKVDRLVRLAASLDGGDTFSPSAQISAAAHRSNQGEPWPLYASAAVAGKDIRMEVTRYLKHISGGETWGLTPDSTGTFHALWVDDRSGTDQVWTSAINVKGAVEPNGSPDLAGLADVSENVAVKVTQIGTDQARHEYSLRVCLANSSGRTLKLPIKLRWLDAPSSLETVEPTNATNGMHGVGAVWDFSAVGRQDFEPQSDPVCAVLSFKLASSPFAINAMVFDPEQFTSTIRFRALGKQAESPRH
jgi:hypothetical protein